MWGYNSSTQGFAFRSYLLNVSIATIIFGVGNKIIAARGIYFSSSDDYMLQIYEGALSTNNITYSFDEIITGNIPTVIRQHRATSIAYNSTLNKIAIVTHTESPGYKENEGGVIFLNYNSTTESYEYKNALTTSTNSVAFDGNDIVGVRSQASGNTVYYGAYTSNTDSYTIANTISTPYGGNNNAGVAIYNNEIALGRKLDNIKHNDAGVTIGTIANDNFTWTQNITSNQGIKGNTVYQVAYNNSGELAVSAFFGVTSTTGTSFISIESTVVADVDNSSIIYDTNLNNGANLNLSGIIVNLTHPWHNVFLHDAKDTIWITVSSGTTYYQAYYINGLGIKNLTNQLKEAYQKTNTISTQTLGGDDEAITLSGSNILEGSNGISDNTPLTFNVLYGETEATATNIGTQTFTTNSPASPNNSQLTSINGGTFGRSNDFIYNDQTEKMDANTPNAEVKFSFQSDLNDIVNAANGYIQIVIINESKSVNAGYYNEIIYLTVDGNTPPDSVPTDIDNVHIINVSNNSTKDVEIPIKGLDVNAKLNTFISLGKTQTSRFDSITGTPDSILFTTPNYIPPTPPGPTPGSSSSKNTAAIIGGTIGGIAALSLITGGGYFVYRKKIIRDN